MICTSGQDWASLQTGELDPSTILIVDDEPDLVGALTELFEGEGYEVATASDGVDALERLRQGLRPSVILLDLMMPRMDGWDFRQEQMKDEDLKDIPTVILTAAGLSKAAVFAEFGEIAFVPKSASPAVLLGALKQSCGDLDL
jgi:two-component system response regulator MprA